MPASTPKTLPNDPLEEESSDNDETFVGMVTFFGKMAGFVADRILIANPVTVITLLAAFAGWYLLNHMPTMSVVFQTVSTSLGLPVTPLRQCKDFWEAIKENKSKE